jgi:hypothetical protein
MNAHSFIEIDAQRYLWCDRVQLRRERRKAHAQRGPEFLVRAEQIGFRHAFHVCPLRVTPEHGRGEGTLAAAACCQ